MNFLKNFAEKAKSVTDSPVRRAEGNSSPGSQQEGFICPLCIASFSSPESLQSHYEQNHTEDADITSNSPHSEKRFGSLGLLNNQNDKDDGISVRSAFGRSDTPQKDDEEKSFYNNQIKALEEAKSLLSSEVISLRQRLASKEQESVPSGRVLERANELAAENVGLKAAIDEISGQKESLEESMKNLEQERINRNTHDDSSVLKQELINVQKAMDDSLKEKEKEYISLKATYEDIFYEKQQMVDSITRKDKELVDLQIKMKKMMDTNENNLTPESQEITDILKSEIHILTKEVSELREGINEKETVIKKHTQELTGKSKDAASKDADIEDLLQAKEQLNVSIESANVLSKNQQVEIEKLKNEMDICKKEKAKVMKSMQEQDENCEVLKRKLDIENAENKSLKSELTAKEALLNEKQNTNADKMREIQKLESELREKEQDNERFLKEKEDLMTKIEAGDGANMAIQQLTSENSILQERLQENTESFKDKETKYASEIEQLRLNIVSLKQESREMKDEEVKSKETSTEKDSKIQKLEKNINELNHRQKELGAEIEEMNSKHKTNVNEITEKLSKITNDLQVKDKSYEKMKKSFDKAEQDLMSKEDFIEELSIKIKSLEKEKDQLSFSNTTLQEDILKDKNTIDKLQTDLNSASDKEVELELKIKNLEEKTLQDGENIKLLKQAKVLLQNEKLALETDFQEKTTMCSELSSKAESKDARIKQLEEGLSETETKVKEMQKAIEDALGKELNLLSDIEEKNKTIFAIEEEKSNIVISFESQQTILERLTSEKDTAEKESRRNKTELQTLEEKICQLQSDIEKERNDIKDEIGELRTAREILLSQVVDLKNEKETTISNFETEIEKSKLELSVLENKFKVCDKSLDSVTQDLKKETAAKKENQQIAADNIATLETRLDSANSEVAKLSTELTKLNEKITNIDKERDTALSKALELEATVGSANEERRGLLERCVAAEAETERTRNMTVELRRKLDDAQAALHELGRENQSIQVELVKQSGRKWKDDTEVVSCSSCTSGFSLTNRKHHCRNCGNIFCNDCSSKQANMTGYKKPQRVCEGCFGELGSK